MILRRLTFWQWCAISSESWRRLLNERVLRPRLWQISERSILFPRMPQNCGKYFPTLLTTLSNIRQKGMIDVELAKDDSARTITLCVRDTGIGFSPVTKVILFQKFGRGNGVEKLHTEGSGIGLYIAREIVKAHNGRVWAESLGEGKGSAFAWNCRRCRINIAALRYLYPFGQMFFKMLIINSA